MTDAYNWDALIEKYIMLGELPRLMNPRDLEEPETYLQRLYREAGSPSDFRDVLVETLQRLSIEGRDVDALRRALRLTKLIPHPDFSSALREAFFIARSRAQITNDENGYREVALLALRAMYALQPVSPQPAKRLAVWEAMWIALLEDSEYRIPAYNGLRYIDVLLALQYLPLLLQQHDGLPFNDLGVLLRSSRRDLDKKRKLDPTIDPAIEIAKTIKQLTENEIAKYHEPFRDAFGDTIVDDAIKQARKEKEKELEQIVMLTKPPSDLPLSSFRQKLFPHLTKWLMERVPVEGVALWLIDQKQGVVHFMGREGLDGEMPPNRLKFGEYISGNIAQSSQHEERLINLDDPDCGVLLRKKYLEAGLHGLLSVREQVDEADGVSLALVVNFFDISTERLEQLREACVRNAQVVVRVAQRAWADYTDFLVADLNAKLSKEPVLAEAARTLAEVARTLFKGLNEAIAYNKETVNLYLYHPDSRRLTLNAYSDPPHAGPSFETLTSRKPTYSLQEGLTGYTARETSPVRIFNIFDKTEVDKLGVRPEQNLSHPELNELQDNEGVSYLGISLREPAPSGFAGRLVGVVEIYRPVKDAGGRVFTPLGQDLLAKLTKAATPFIASALNSEWRIDEPSVLAVDEQFEELHGNDIVTAALEKAEQSFRAEADDLLLSWDVAGETKRRFYAFRTIQDRCKPFWLSPKPEFQVGERDARRALQRAILAHDDLLKKDEPAIIVTPDLLARFNILDEHREQLLSLGLLLVPLINGRRVTGLIGLECGSIDRALNATRTIKTEQESTTKYVRTSMMRNWREYRRHLHLLFETFLKRLSTEAAAVRNIDRAHFFNFLAHGRPDLKPSEEKSFADLMKMALRPPSSDDKCKLKEECVAWKDFAKDGQLQMDDIRPVELLAMPSAVRMVLATSTVPLLWGGKAELSLLEDTNGFQSGWSNLRIRVPPNGHEDMRRQGLALARGISEYRGWNYSDPKADEITITLPYVEDDEGTPGC